MHGKATHIVPYDFSGPKEESLFHDIYMDLTLIQTIYPKLNVEYENLKSEFSQIRDDRSLALVGAMIIENKVDDFLSVIIKKYGELTELKEFTFSFKILLARSMKLIPSKIFNAIEPIRRIRNGFAHDLSIKSFADYLASQATLVKRKQDFENLGNKLATFNKALVTKRPHDDFMMLTNSIVYSLMIYKEQLLRFRDVLTDPSFVESIFGNAPTHSANDSEYGTGAIPIEKFNMPENSESKTTD